MGTSWKIPKINVKHGNNFKYNAYMLEYDLINYKVHGCILPASPASGGM
jgi:hypothetical protein